MVTSNKSTQFFDSALFMTAFTEQAATDTRFIVLFSGTVKEKTGKSWCPACIDAAPYIDRITEIAEAKNCPVLKASVAQ